MINEDVIRVGFFLLAFLAITGPAASAFQEILMLSACNYPAL
jgi:hypothetical protein